MSQENNTVNGDFPIIPCPVEVTTLIPLIDEKAKPCVLHKDSKPIIKIPVVLAETTIQIVVEANIPLDPPAVEIKRVFKDVFLTQCKLVPVKFSNDKCQQHEQNYL